MKVDNENELKSLKCQVRNLIFFCLYNVFNNLFIVIKGKVLLIDEDGSMLNYVVEVL